MDEFRNWVYGNLEINADFESEKCFRGLLKEVTTDWDAVRSEWRDLEGGLQFIQNEDGTYKVGTSDELYPPGFWQTTETPTSSQFEPSRSNHNIQSITSTTSNQARSHPPMSDNNEDVTRTGSPPHYPLPIHLRLMPGP